MACHRGHCPMFNRIAREFKDLNFSHGIINAGCSFDWSNSNEGSKFWCEEDDAIHRYAGYTSKSLKFIKERLKLIFEDTTLIRKKKF